MTINIDRVLRRRQSCFPLEILNPWCVPHLSIPVAGSLADRPSEKEIKCDCFLMHAMRNCCCTHYSKREKKWRFSIETRKWKIEEVERETCNVDRLFSAHTTQFFIWMVSSAYRMCSELAHFQEVTDFSLIFLQFASIFFLIPFRYDRVLFSTFLCAHSVQIDIVSSLFFGPSFLRAVDAVWLMTDEARKEWRVLSSTIDTI